MGRTPTIGLDCRYGRAPLRDRAVGLENTEILAYLPAEADRVLADEPPS